MPKFSKGGRRGRRGIIKIENKNKIEKKSLKLDNTSLLRH